MTRPAEMPIDLDRLRQQSCSRKLRHRTKRKAILQYNKGRRSTGEMDVYRCAFCAGWHLGHATRNPRIALIYARLPELLAQAASPSIVPEMMCREAA